MGVLDPLFEGARNAHARRAAMFAERDGMAGVSQNIMLGQLAPLGTGAFGLMLDEAKLADAIEVGGTAASIAFSDDASGLSVLSSPYPCSLHIVL